jgi:hypothetical protein
LRRDNRFPFRTRANLRRRTGSGAGYLPRPALGRRPWFAFLRRARMRRRFALAMGGEANRAENWRHSTVRLRSGTWGSSPLVIAATRRQRRRGLGPVPGPLGLLLRTRSVHGFALRSAVEFVAIDDIGVVRRVGRLAPGRVVACRHAGWIAELPAGSPLPEPGSVVAVDRLGP